MQLIFCWGVDKKGLPHWAFLRNAQWGSACDTGKAGITCCDKHADTDQLQYWHDSRGTGWLSRRKYGFRDIFWEWRL